MKLSIFKKSLLTSLIIAGVVLFGSCSGQVLQTVTEESEANEILDVLREHGIQANKNQVGEAEKSVYEITVNGGDIEYGASLQLMEDHCLPQSLPPKVETSGLVSSIEVEQAQELRRTKIDIVSLLRQLPGTTCVDISIVPPENKSLSLNPYKASATVLIKHKTENFGLTVDQIARMVAGAVQGLTADNVHVTLTRQPLRPLPDINGGRNIRRIIYVSAIGLTTILLFLGLVVFLRKRKSAEPEDGKIDDSEFDLIEDNESEEEFNLLEEVDEEINPQDDEDSTE